MVKQYLYNIMHAAYMQPSQEKCHNWNMNQMIIQQQAEYIILLYMPWR